MKKTNQETRKTNYSEVRQKLIYYQSEAAKYKFLCDKYEYLISQALLSKNIEEQKPQEVEKDPISDVTSYFNHSFIQDKETNQHFIYGSFIVTNSGETTLTNPIICLKVNEPRQTIVGGKIGEVSGASNKVLSAFEEWSYLHEDWRHKWLEKGELWLKPKQTTELPPGEKLIFSGFDIKFKENHSLKQVIVEAFCYFEQLSSGRKSLNSISLTF
ncbi:hypothetical protein DS745_17955 [Anaerobacillus alkaliphilus]|uniref:Uncharacterized protein n=1 Tax=Anaerobacillus alkaliphilus TaxID=1548597 RepID=A0A4Q0VQ38_9BACI|nr:hypothetical protein [Anaerobacillus alkaliphilus]RXI98221.1 hypothetical protein DS745_17955 [Anaerobacillus alkaliphilus]